MSSQAVREPWEVEVRGKVRKRGCVHDANKPNEGTWRANLKPSKVDLSFLHRSVAVQNIYIYNEKLKKKTLLAKYPYVCYTPLTTMGY